MYIGAQRERSLSLTSSVFFDDNPLPSLCPGSTVHFYCIAVDFPSIDWDKNDARIEQYTPTSNVGVVTDPVAGLTIVFTNKNGMGAFSADFNSTLTATINEGVSVGDIITCGIEFLNTTNIVVNYTAVCELSFTDLSNMHDRLDQQQCYVLMSLHCNTDMEWNLTLFLCSFPRVVDV